MVHSRRTEQSTIVLSIKDGVFKVESAPVGTRVCIHVYDGNGNVPSEVIQVFAPALPGRY